MKQLHITLGSGHTHDVDLQPASMLIVRTRKQNDLGVIEDVEQAFSDVTDVTVIEVDDPKIAEPNIIQENPFLGTPETAARVAREMPIGDAGALLEEALEKFPGDEGLLAAQAEISAKMQASADAPSTAVAETPTETETAQLTDPFQSTGAAPAAEQQPIATATAAAGVTDVTVTDTSGATIDSATTTGEAPTPDPSAAASSDASATSSSTDSPSSDTATDETAPGDPAVPSHDEAVATVDASVDAIADATTADHETELIAKAVADVDAALELYPDSAELQDAKAQLTQVSPPPAA